MKLGHKKQIIILISISLLIFSFIIAGFLRIRKEDRLLEQSPVFGIAVIVDTYLGTKARDFVRYEFIVEGKIYDGHQRFYPNLEVVEIGDSCEVIFAKTNPEINELVIDENNRLRVRKKSGSFK
jgi:hypothetical protein